MSQKKQVSSFYIVILFRMTILCMFCDVGLYRVRVLNASFNNISVILWQSICMVEKKRRKPRSQVTDKLYHNVVSSKYLSYRYFLFRMTIVSMYCDVGLYISCKTVSYTIFITLMLSNVLFKEIRFHRNFLGFFIVFL